MATSDAGQDDRERLPIACDLSALDAGGRARRAELAEYVRANTARVVARPNGYDLHLAPGDDVWRNAEELVGLERRCCAFLTFDLRLDEITGAAVLAITGEAAAKEFIEAMMADSRAPRIERLTPEASEADLGNLAQLLVDAVESGAAVSFLAPLTPDRAYQWWRAMMAASGSRVIVLVARDGDGIVGTVQLHPAWAPNQPHRAEIAKLLVHRRSRGAGLGCQLMGAVEDAARDAGFTLLTLDTKRGDAAERLYLKLGWTAVGSIPGYALDPDGTPHDAVIFFKDLIRGPTARRS